jgi:predicted kinase
VTSPRVHLVEGPVGAGKSTYAFRLSRRIGAPHLDLDDWMATLFRPDRPEGDDVMGWYLERKDRCLDQILRVADEILESGSEVVLELGLVRRIDRDGVLGRLDGQDRPVVLHVLDAPRDLRRERVRRRNRAQGATYSMTVPDAVFERASDLWEPVADDEVEGRETRFVDTAGPS